MSVLGLAVKGAGAAAKKLKLGERLNREDAYKLKEYWNGVDPNSTTMEPTRQATQKRFGPRYDVTRVPTGDSIPSFMSPKPVQDAYRAKVQAEVDAAALKKAKGGRINTLAVKRKAKR